MSQGGSGPYDYGPQGNGPLPFRGPLNPNDPSSNQYNPNSFMPHDGRFDPYAAPSNPGGHRSSTTLPPRYPNPNRGFQPSDYQNRRSISPSAEQIPPSRSSITTQSATLPIFDTLATQAHLNAENRERARICSNRMENDPRLIGLVVYTAQCHQDIIQRLTQLPAPHPSATSLSTITPTASTPEWIPKEELKKFCVDVLLESISDPTLQAYTLTEGVISAAGQKKTLTHSLEMIVQIRIQNKDDAWKSRNFPPGSTARFPSEVIKEIKKKIKIVRENLHSILRHNASPSHGNMTNPLPTLQDIYLAMADFPGLGQRIATDEAVIAEATNNLAKKSRYAYLRMQAVCLEVSTQGNGSAIWKSVDQQLGNLRLNGARFTEVFYKLVLEDDKLLFNGVNTLDDIKKHPNLNIPDNQRVTEALAALSVPPSSDQNTDATEA